MMNSTVENFFRHPGCASIRARQHGRSVLEIEQVGAVNKAGDNGRKDSPWGIIASVELGGLKAEISVGSFREE